MSVSLRAVFRQAAVARQLSTGKATLGRNHTESEPMPVYYSPIYTHKLPDRHRFPMQRYETVYKTLQSRMADEQLHLAIHTKPRFATTPELLLAHEPDFVHRYLSGQMTAAELKVIGFPWTKHFRDRTITIVGNSLQAMDDVLTRGFRASCNAAGGTHHAFSDHGEGYCIFNDLGVAGHLAIKEHGCQQVLVIDLDVHQGNGTSQIFHQNPKVFTFGMHGDKNYPWRSAFAGDLDIAVPDEVTEDQYLGYLGRALEEISIRLPQTPDIVFFQAGVDPLAEDRLGRLGLSREALQQRNRLVFDWCGKHSLPVVCLMGGGYAEPIQLSADCHVDVFCQAAEYNRQQLQEQRR